jgi:integrase
MPKLPHGRPPSYRLHRASGQAVVTLDGRDHYLGPYKTAVSHREYDRLVAEWLANGRNLRRRADASAGATVTELIAEYKRFAEERYRRDGRPTGELSKIKAACRPLRKLYGHTRAGDFDALAFETVRKAMIDAGLARTTINYHLGKLRRMFKWGVKRKLVPPDVLVAIQSVEYLRPGDYGVRDTEPVAPVDERHVEAVLPHVRPPVAAMIRLQLLTAMRPGEVVAMTTGQIDRSCDVWVYRPRRHKTSYRGKVREVALGPRAQALLTPLLKADPDAPLFSPAADDETRRAERRARRATPMTPSQRARTPKAAPKRRPRLWYDKDAYIHAIRRGCDKAGVPRWGPNRLRHLAATKVRRAYGLEAAQVILGHARADVTQIYAAANRDRAVEVARQVG